MTAVLASRPPRPRGPLSAWVVEALEGPVRDLPPGPLPTGADEDDLHLALYCCYELHYGGFAGVDDRWEWDPQLIGWRAGLERSFEDHLGALVGPVGAPNGPEAVIEELWRIATTGGGPSLSGWLADHPTLERVRELSQMRSVYQLKEADPHTWAIPRLAGAAKAVMVAIQSDEYGDGDPAAVHATLFADSMRSLGLDDRPNAYLDVVPGVALATVNLISLLGLHRRWRGALAGHLALFEMTSSAPMARYAEALRSLGLPDEACRFYEVHVEADQIHQRLATDGMVGALVETEPGLAGDVCFGARALSALEAATTGHLLDAWQGGRSALLSTAGATRRPAPLSSSPLGA